MAAGNPDLGRQTARQTRQLAKVAQFRAAKPAENRATRAGGIAPAGVVYNHSPLTNLSQANGDALRLGLLREVASGASSRTRGATFEIAFAKKTAAKRTRVKKVAAKKTPAKTAKTRKTSSTRTATKRRRVKRYSPWITPTFADSTIGDNIDGDELEVRRAAVQALGAYNGTVVVADPLTGRILTIVNQKLAVKEAFIPCSTVKLVAGIGALSEGLIEPDEKVRLSRYQKVDLTEALAKSNNLYFAKLGQRLGYDKVSEYAKLLGVGEKAGLGIKDEDPGLLASETPPAGMGRMTSFGDGIEYTALQLTSIVSTIANGGTVYYLQYPKSAEEAVNFVPRVKRDLDIQGIIDEMKPGMLGATNYGTARRASYDPDEPIYGKTGTCTDAGKRAHVGWFGSFNEVGDTKLVVTVLLTGGKPVSGPLAAGIAGKVYKNLSEKEYFSKKRELSPTTLIEAASYGQ